MTDTSLSETKIPEANVADTSAMETSIDESSVADTSAGETSIPEAKLIWFTDKQRAVLLEKFSSSQYPSASECQGIAEGIGDIPTRVQVILTGMKLLLYFIICLNNVPNSMKLGKLVRQATMNFLHLYSGLCITR